ncbi:MAG TPA: exosortase-associated EpsI family protein [Gemmataceae bacterium]|nr:exosortase-associated EpsI family protein [Gemmataceae bacterium]
MPRRIPLLAGLILVVATAVVQGVWTQRWQQSAVMETALRRLSYAPGDLGTWKADPVDFDAEALAAAGAQRSWVRRYTDARTGVSVLVILLCGRSGKMSVHRPEHCYGSAGYAMMTDPLRSELSVDPPAHCWTTRFRKEESTGNVKLRIFWTWFGDGLWQAPESPRLHFAHLSALYKLYTIRELPPRQERLADDPTLDLLHRLLPALTEALTHE